MACGQERERGRPAADRDGQPYRETDARTSGDAGPYLGRMVFARGWGLGEGEAEAAGGGDRIVSDRGARAAVNNRGGKALEGFGWPVRIVY